MVAKRSEFYSIVSASRFEMVSTRFAIPSCQSIRFDSIRFDSIRFDSFSFQLFYFIVPVSSFYTMYFFLSEEIFLFKKLIGSLRKIIPVNASEFLM